MYNILIVNGSLSGVAGNTAELLAIAEEYLSEHAKVNYLELARDPSVDSILSLAEQADAFLFGTGTYWDSWGSPLQKFLEGTSHTEGEHYWVGKPAGVIVTAHAVGGKGIISRLFGVLNVYGMTIPPFAGFAYTYVNHIALPSAPEPLKAELWTSNDVGVVCNNLLETLNGKKRWKQWPADADHYTGKWLDIYSNRVGKKQ